MTPDTSRDFPAVGDVIANRFRVLEILGAGAQAKVCVAQDSHVDAKVALKVYRPDGFDLARIRREVKSVQQIQNFKNVVRIHDLGVDEERDRVFVSMKYVEGQTLETFLASVLRPTVDVCLRILLGICDGLGAVAEVGLTHRDLKPENILLEPNGNVMLLDFGLALTSSDPSITHGVWRAGTPLYMAPEQYQKGEITHRTDLYAVGVIAYRMCTGRLPFVHKELTVVQAMHLAVTPTPIREVNPAVPRELETLIGKLLAKDPAQRVPHVRDLRAELDRIHRQLLAAAAKRVAPPKRPSPPRSMAPSPRPMAPSPIADVQRIEGHLRSYWGRYLGATLLLFVLLRDALRHDSDRTQALAANEGEPELGVEEELVGEPYDRQSEHAVQMETHFSVPARRRVNLSQQDKACFMGLSSRACIKRVDVTREMYVVLYVGGNEPFSQEIASQISTCLRGSRSERPLAKALDEYPGDCIEEWEVLH